MAILEFENIGITGLSACVPKNISSNSGLTAIMSKEDVEKTINAIGIKEKRLAPENICSSDLCYEAAVKLFSDLSIDKSEIDVLIFMTQTPDYHMPANAPLMQEKLGLSKSTACFDINLACSGFVYSLSTAFLYATQKNIRKVLLLTGETMSKIVSSKDKENAPLFGDAGTAAIIEKGNFRKSFFSLNSDGSGRDHLIIPGGGYRNPSSAETLMEKEYENGNFRNLQQLYMNGLEVFNFTMREVPKDIKGLLAYAGESLENIDMIVFHQANKFMTDFFSKKLKIPLDKVPYSLERFGNTSSASVPLTIVSELNGSRFQKRDKVILSAFGSGLSWCTAYVDLTKCSLSDIVEL
jgi:3-oxoacyl-[acyl-carrier-protein] synthase-3